MALFTLVCCAITADDDMPVTAMLKVPVITAAAEGPAVPPGWLEGPGALVPLPPDGCPDGPPVGWPLGPPVPPVGWPDGPGALVADEPTDGGLGASGFDDVTEGIDEPTDGGLGADEPTDGGLGACGLDDVTEGIDEPTDGGLGAEERTGGGLGADEPSDGGLGASEVPAVAFTPSVVPSGVSVLPSEVPTLTTGPSGAIIPTPSTGPVS